MFLKNTDFNYKYLVAFGQRSQREDIFHCDLPVIPPGFFCKILICGHAYILAYYSVDCRRGNMLLYVSLFLQVYPNKNYKYVKKPPTNFGCVHLLIA